MKGPPANPQVSVLLPFRNAEAHIEAAVASVLAQEGVDFELLCIDDASTDRGRARLLAMADERVRILDAGGGLVAALNAGLAASGAPWVARMDADDLMPQGRLRAQLDRGRELDAPCLVGGAVELLAGDLEIGAGLQRYVDWLNSLQSHDALTRDLFVESPFAHPSVMYRRDMVRDLGAYRGGDFPEDYDLWLRLWEAGGRFAKVAQTVLTWRHHSRRLTFSDPRYRPEAFLRLKVAALVRAWLGERRCVSIAGAGRDGKRLRKALLEEAVEVRAWFDLDPRKIGQRIHGAPVLAYDALGRQHAPVLSCVGVPGARALIRDALTAKGLIEQRDFLCLA